MEEVRGGCEEVRVTEGVEARPKMLTFVKIVANWSFL